MIDRDFVERIAIEKRGYGILRQYANWRHAGEHEDIMQESLLALWTSRENLDRHDRASAYFQGIVKNTAMNYRLRAIDRAAYCEVQEWNAIAKPDEVPDSVQRDQDEREACARLDQLLRKVRLPHRITIWEWRKRGYRCDTHSQECALSKAVEALGRAAGVPRHLRPARTRMSVAKPR